MKGYGIRNRMGMGSRKGSGYVQKRKGNTTSQIRMGRDQGKEEGN